MTSKRILTGFFLLSLASTGIIGQVANDVPAFHTTPPQKGVKIDPILKPAELTKATTDFEKHAYELAAKPGMARVLYQLPCYCHCDRMLGHTSLHSCFSNHDEHGAVCGTCLKELYFSYKMTQQKWTVKQIREAIMKPNPDWENIDLQTAGNIE